MVHHQIDVLILARNYRGTPTHYSNETLVVSLSTAPLAGLGLMRRVPCRPPRMVSPITHALDREGHGSETDVQPARASPPARIKLASAHCNLGAEASEA